MSLWLQLRRDRELRAALFAFSGMSLWMAMVWFIFRISTLISVLAVMLFGFLLIIVICLMCQRVLYMVVFSSGCLGIVFSTGVCGFCCSNLSRFSSFFLYMVVMSVFHWTEYVVTALTNRRTLTVDSFLLNHSRQYWLAAAASWLEYSTRTFLLPGWHSDVLTAFGFILCLLGEVLRKGAMFTARVSFTHTISTRKRSEHQLITNGVYSLCRHPAYVGWFIFSIGTQMILCNMICMVGYAIVAWRFFDLRIFDEEMFLINFFGIDYIEYQRRVPVGLPFITGYRESV